MWAVHNRQLMYPLVGLLFAAGVYSLLVVPEQEMQEYNFAGVASILITLESDDNIFRELDGYLDRLEERLRTIPSVANVHRYGSQKEQITIYITNNGKRCILLSVEAQPKANIITFGNEVNRTLEQFQSELPESVGMHRRWHTGLPGDHPFRISK
jgi:multidrug efflux pump subunit AcrB